MIYDGGSFLDEIADGRLEADFDTQGPVGKVWGFLVIVSIIHSHFLLFASTLSLHINALIKPQDPIRFQYAINAL